MRPPHLLCLLKALTLLLLGSCRSPRHLPPTHTVRTVRDTVVVRPGVQVQRLLPVGDTLRLDTGRLRLQLFPVFPVGYDTPQHYRVQAACVPDTVRVPRLIRETVWQPYAPLPQRPTFWHRTGQVLALGLALALVLGLLWRRLR
jgi:hypothetical protein